MRRVLVLVLWVLVAVAVVGWYVVGSVQKHDVSGSHESTVSGQGTFINLEDYLQAARRDYVTSDADHRAVIRTVVLHEVEKWGLDHIKDPSLTAWVIDLQKEEKR